MLPTHDSKIKLAPRCEHRISFHFDHHLSKQTDRTASSPIPVRAGSSFVRFRTSIVKSTLVGCDPLLLLCFENFLMTVDIFELPLNNARFLLWQTMTLCNRAGQIAHRLCAQGKCRKRRCKPTTFLLKFRRTKNHRRHPPLPFNKMAHILRKN